MFAVDMETHIPTPAERYTVIRGKLCARLDAEGVRYGLRRMLDLLVLDLITYMINWCVWRAEQQLLEQACGDDGAVAGIVAAGRDACTERRGAAGGSDGGGGVAVENCGCGGGWRAGDRRRGWRRLYSERTG